MFAFLISIHISVEEIKSNVVIKCGNEVGWLCITTVVVVISGLRLGTIEGLEESFG
jgi:hypothetical protein